MLCEEYLEQVKCRRTAVTRAAIRESRHALHSGASSLQASSLNGAVGHNFESMVTGQPQRMCRRPQQIEMNCLEPGSVKTRHQTLDLEKPSKRIGRCCVHL